MGLGEVTLLNVEVVRILTDCEDEGSVAEGIQSQAPDGT